VPCQDHPIELQNLLFEAEQVSAERGKARMGNLGHPLVTRVGNNMEQFGDPSASDRRNNTELGEMRSDRINHCDLLANEQMTGSVEHQTALLLGCLGWHEPHVGSGDRLANRFCVGHVVLLPFDVGLNVSWRHQSHGMTERLKFARPMVRRGAGLYANQTCWQLLKEPNYLATLQLAADDHLASAINAMNLKDRLGDIETDCCYRLHGSLL
jgi:hypothetical protein